VYSTLSLSCVDDYVLRSRKNTKHTATHGRAIVVVVVIDFAIRVLSLHRATQPLGRGTASARAKAAASSSSGSSSARDRYEELRLFVRRTTPDHLIRYWALDGRYVSSALTQMVDWTINACRPRKRSSTWKLRQRDGIRCPSCTLRRSRRVDECDTTHDPAECNNAATRRGVIAGRGLVRLVLAPAEVHRRYGCGGIQLLRRLPGTNAPKHRGRGHDIWACCWARHENKRRSGSTRSFPRFLLQQGNRRTRDRQGAWTKSIGRR